MMKKKEIVRFSLLLFSALLFCTFSFAQKTKVKPQINWISFEQLQDSMRINPKPVFIDIYTDWCGPCKLMDKKTFPNKYVVKAMNESYYAVKLNAERRDTIRFNGTDYTWKIVRDGKGAHGLAVEIGWESNTLAFPTIVIFDKNYKLQYRYPSFLTAEMLEEVLIQFR